VDDVAVVADGETVDVGLDGCEVVGFAFAVSTVDDSLLHPATSSRAMDAERAFRSRDDGWELEYIRCRLQRIVVLSMAANALERTEANAMMSLCPTLGKPVGMAVRL
jgi:hypothetical protein